MKLEITYEYLKREGYEPYYENGYLKINGSFSCNYNQLTKLVIPDNFAVGGGFYCDNNKLTELIIPDNFVIGGSFYCNNNQLTKLVIPDNFVVGGNFYCENNKLTKLVIPDNFVIGGSFYCHINQLTKLVIPDNFAVGGGFYCDNNKLTELIIPDNFVIGGSFYCNNNQLTKLVIPDNFVVGGNFYCENNKLTKLVIPDNFVIGGSFYCHINQLTKLVIPDKFVIGGSFSCSSNQLKEQPKSPKKLEQGYYGHYCYYDNILRRVDKVKEIDGYIAYITPFDVVMVDKNGISAHGKTVKEARRDLIFKTTKRDTSQYRNININEERDLDYLYVAYRNITGSCKLGTEEFMMQNNINEDNKPKSIKEVIELTCNKKAYRSDVFKEFFSRD